MDQTNLNNTVYFFVLICAILITACKGSDPGKMSQINVLEITVSYTEPYCGGAPPTDEIIAKSKIEKSLASETLFISKSDPTDENILKFETDSDGIIKAELKEGHYFVFFPNKVNVKHANSISKACEKWALSPDGVLDVTTNKNTYKISLRKSCNPCESPNR